MLRKGDIARSDFWHAMLFDSTGNFHNLVIGPPGAGLGSLSYAYSINDSGTIVGLAPFQYVHAYRIRACIFDPTGHYININLGTLGGNSSAANSVNNSGQIVGDASTVSGKNHATLFDPTGQGNNIDLDPNNTGSSTALCINDKGQIVGVYGNFRYNYTGREAVLFDSTGNGKNIRLGKLPGAAISSAEWINVNGQIVGCEGPSLYYGHATLFDATGSGNNIDLNTLIDPNSTRVLQRALAINDNGWIICDSYAKSYQTGTYKSCLLIPTVAIPADITFMNSTKNQVHISWKCDDPNAQGFYVERSDTGIRWLAADCDSKK